MVGDEFLDHVEADDPVVGGEQVLENLLGEGQIDGASGKGREGDEAYERPLELADVGADLGGDEDGDVVGDVDALGLCFLPENGDFGLQIGGLYVGGKSPFESRAEPFL